MSTGYAPGSGCPSVDNPVDNVKKFAQLQLSRKAQKKYKGFFLYIWSNNAHGYVNQAALRLQFYFIIKAGSAFKSYDFSF